MRAARVRGKSRAGSAGGRILRWCPPILWTGVVFVLSSDLASEAHTRRFIIPVLRFFFFGLSPETYALLHGVLRKLAHLTEYAVLSALWARALAGRGARWRARHVAAALTVCILTAIGDEVHQAWVPSRSSSAADVGIDTLGALAGQLAVGLGTRRRRWAVDAEGLGIGSYPQ